PGRAGVAVWGGRSVSMEEPAVDLHAPAGAPGGGHLRRLEDDRSLHHGVPGRAAKRAARISGSGPDGWSLSHAGVLEDHDAVAPSHHRVRRGEWLRHRDRLV